MGVVVQMLRSEEGSALTVRMMSFHANLLWGQIAAPRSLLLTHSGVQMGAFPSLARGFARGWPWTSCLREPGSPAAPRPQAGRVAWGPRGTHLAPEADSEKRYDWLSSATSSWQRLVVIPAARVPRASLLFIGNPSFALSPDYGTLCGVCQAATRGGRGTGWCCWGVGGVWREGQMLLLSRPME